jgi:hypothetical protein
MKLMAKLLAITIGSFAFWPLAAATAASSDLLFGQQHSYTVTMRGNGEAVVMARIVFTNTGDKVQNTFDFQAPGSAAPSELSGFQQNYPQVCSRYGPTPLKSSSGANVVPTILPCLEYLTPDYSSAYGQGVEYKKLKFASSGGNNYRVTLPLPVESQQTSSILISYSSMGYTHGSFGSYSFSFQTLKVNQRVASSSVAISVDADQYLQGKSSVSYQPTVKNEISAQVGAVSPNYQTLNQVSDSLGRGGEVDKQANDLAPGDTLTVTGRYASSLFLLHLPGLLATLGFLVLVVVILFVLRKRIMKFFHTHHAPRKNAPSVAALAAQPGAASAHIHPPTIFAGAGNVLAGLISALGVSGVTWFASWYTQSQLYSQNQADTFTSTLIMITVVLAYLLFGLGPSVYLAATHRDWRRLVFAVTFEVLFLVAFVFIYAVAIGPLFNPPPTQVDDPGFGTKVQ